MNEEKSCFNSDGHISDLYLALCSDRLREENFERVPVSVRSHMEDCENCRRSVLDIFSTTMFTGKDLQPELKLFSVHEPPGRSFPIRLVLRTAATFLVLALITSIYLMIDTNEPVNINMIKKGERSTAVNPGKDTGKKDSLSIEKADVTTFVKTDSNSGKDADTFKDNPNLEYMVDSPQRGRLIHIISPEFRNLEQGKIIFRWENHLDKDLDLKILNNLNETLYTFKANGSKVEFSGKLPPGLYYWKLEDREHLYHVGKFLIRE